MENQSFISKTYPVHMDIFPDVLKILLRNCIDQSNEGVNVNEGIIWLNVKYPVDHPFGNEVRKNIEEMLTDYGYYTSNDLSAMLQEESAYRKGNQFNT